MMKAAKKKKIEAQPKTTASTVGSFEEEYGVKLSGSLATPKTRLTTYLKRNGYEALGEVLKVAERKRVQHR